MAVYSIKDLETLSGIKAHTIRIWEKRYGLIEPHRTTTNIRYYTDHELKKILNVAVLNRQGIKISNIAKLSDDELKGEIIRVSEANPDLAHSIDSLILAMIEIDEIKFSSILTKSISKKGLKEVMIEIVYPFLKRTGVMWLSGEVNPVQEHFVTYLIRQKLIASIENISGNFRTDAKSFLLFLPEKEWHEIGLLFASYLIKEAGHHVIYLGQSVPYSDVLATGALAGVDCLLLSGTTSRSQTDFINYLKDLGRAFPDKKILFFSSFIDQTKIDLPDQFFYLENVPALVDYLSKVQ